MSYPPPHASSGPGPTVHGAQGSPLHPLPQEAHFLGVQDARVLSTHLDEGPKLAHFAGIHGGETGVAGGGRLRRPEARPGSGST